MMAQNCLIPKGPPKFDTVNVPPCKESKPSIQHPIPCGNNPSMSSNEHKTTILTSKSSGFKLFSLAFWANCLTSSPILDRPFLSASCKFYTWIHVR
jgi:hypothetical protein